MPYATWSIQTPYSSETPSSSETPNPTSDFSSPAAMRQYKICVEETTPKTRQQLKTIRYIAGPNNQAAASKAQAAFLKDNIWNQNSTIKISFGEVDFDELAKRGMKLKPPQPFYNPISNLTPPIDPLSQFVQDTKDPRESIKKVVQERIQKIVNLKFVFVDKFEDGDIRIGFKDDGAWSYIGTDILDKKYSGQSTMNFGWIDAPTIIHEFGHAISMIHEHQNSKGGGIPWNVQAVEKWAKTTQGWDVKTTEENIIDKYALDQLNGSDFDPDSIMLYYYPANLTKNNCCGTKMNCRLSSTDVIWISKLYGIGAEMTPEQFYEYAYNEKLQTGIKKESFSNKKSASLNCYINRCAKRTRENFCTNYFKSSTHTVIMIGILIAFLLVYLFTRIA
jgi:hypothetical protein